MKILSIETSCDETGIAILESGAEKTISILGNALSSQIEIHAQYGGVFPALAKRAHAEKITFLVQQALSDAELLEAVDAPVENISSELSFLDEKETQLKEHLVPFLTYYKKPDIDYIAVTVGPGLEPALWVGINTAKALSKIWNIPVIPINHMEGHVVTAVFQRINEQDFILSPIDMPILSLLVSGGHTELVLSSELGKYQKIGQTRDDAVGEAFDKVARVLGLPYPGGPAVSGLAREWRDNEEERLFELPRPMLHSGDYDFSFSGIKTAVLYTVRDLNREMTDEEKRALAGEFENAAIEVLVHKTLKALSEHNAQTVVVGGGVAGNTYLREQLSEKISKLYPEVSLLFPEMWLATDNAVMIGMAGMLKIFSEQSLLRLDSVNTSPSKQGYAGQVKTRNPEELRADGNLSL